MIMALFASPSHILRKRGVTLPYYRFHEADGSAAVITDDITGSKLPPSKSGWKADGLTDVVAGGRPRFGVETTEIIASILRDGFFHAPLGQSGRFRSE